MDPVVKWSDVANGEKGDVCDDKAKTVAHGLTDGPPETEINVESVEGTKEDVPSDTDKKEEMSEKEKEGQPAASVDQEAEKDVCCIEEKSADSVSHGIDDTAEKGGADDGVLEAKSPSSDHVSANDVVKNESPSMSLKVKNEESKDQNESEEKSTTPSTGDGIIIRSTDEADKPKGRPTPPALPAKPARLRSTLVSESPCSSPEVYKTANDNFSSATESPAKYTSPQKITDEPREKPSVSPSPAPAPAPAPAAAAAVSPKSPRFGRRQFQHTKQLLTGIFRGRERSPKKSVDPLSVPRPTDVKQGDCSVDGESLPHLTRERPRNPNKRPPSQAFLKEMAAGTTDESALPARMPSVSPTMTKKPLPTCPNKPLRPPPIGVKRNENQPIPENLKDEFVSKEDFAKLRAAFDEFRRDALDRIKELESRIPDTGDQAKGTQ